MAAAPAADQQWPAAAAPSFAPPPPSAPPCGAERLALIQSRLRALRAGILNFWLKHGVDEKFGGFHATLERGGKIGRPTDKGIVPQCRHAWAMSRAVASGALRAGGAEARAAEAAARSAWKFMVDHLHRADRPGTWRWLVSRDGARVVNDGTALYGQFFAIYAASAYYKAFNDPAALALALQTFRATDAGFHDAANGGYDETLSRPILHDVRLRADGSGSWYNATAAAASAAAAATTTGGPKATAAAATAAAGGAPAEVGGRLPATLNVFLHATEALAALYDASGDAAVLARLKELLALVAGRLVTPAGVMYEYYDPLTWRPAGPPAINFGHNLESAWLVATTCDLLVARGALDAAAAAGYKASVMRAAANAAAAGYDAAHGGVFEAGVPGLAPGAGDGASTEKVWWVQAESMLALWQLAAHERSCAPVEKLEGTLAFFERALRDPSDGEVAWSVSADGRALGGRGWQKGNLWKASYHDSRVTMFLDAWLEAAKTGAAAAAADTAGAAEEGVGSVVQAAVQLAAAANKLHGH